MVFESTFFKWYLIDYSKLIIKDYWLSGRFDYEDITEFFDRRKAVRFLRYEFLFPQELTFMIKKYIILNFSGTSALKASDEVYNITI